jgi:RimJ/RimL family protein N-acetyltransferase
MFETGRVIKIFTSEKGNEIVIRYPKWEDLDNMLAYINALIDEDTFINLYDKHVTRKEEQESFTKWFKNMQERKGCSIVGESKGTLIASCGFTCLTGRSKNIAELGITIHKDYRDEGIGTVLMETLIEEARRINVRTLRLNCFENNERALHLYEKVGFKRIGILPEALAYKGTYIGEILMYKNLNN